MIVDFHSHILPGIDDGSTDINMTKAMLSSCHAQSISVQVATPHFYASSMQPEEFLLRRRCAFEAARGYAESLGIRLICGAEVAFFRNISEAEELEKLMIDGTRLLLLEMPFRQWSERDLKEVRTIIKRGITPIIAHIERFSPFQKDKAFLDELMEMKVLIQVNAESLLSWRTRGSVVRLFECGKAHLLASDCHNLSTRSQNLAKGREVLEKKLGSENLKSIDQRSRILIGNIE